MKKPLNESIRDDLNKLYRPVNEDEDSGQAEFLVRQTYNLPESYYEEKQNAPMSDDEIYGLCKEQGQKVKEEFVDMPALMDSVDLEAKPPKDDLNTTFGYEKRPRQLDEAVKPVAQIKVDDFLDWVYSDRDEYTELGDQMIKELQATGKASLTLDQIMEGLGYLPTSKIENFDEIESQLAGVQGIDEEEIVNPAMYIDVNWVK